MKDSKSCIVNFRYCFLTGTFKDLQAHFLPSSYFSMKLHVSTGKILLTGGGNQANK